MTKAAPTWNTFIALLPALLLLGVVLAPDPATAQLPTPTNCQPDLQGANDQPGQKDLTQFCVDSGDNTPYELHTLWNWDDETLPGGNTGDACTLYDTDGDGNANLVVCVTTMDGGDPMSLGATRLFTCNDANPDKCSGPTQLAVNKCVGGDNDGLACSVLGDCLVAGPNDGICLPDPTLVDTTCDVSQQSTDPFDGTVLNGPGDNYPTDSEAVCAVDLDDFSVCSGDGSTPCTSDAGCTTAGGTCQSAGSAQLIDACSYPSESVNSDPSDCILFTACSVDADCDDGNECTTDTCNTTVNACNFVPKAAGTACGDGSDTVCDAPDTCDELGFCQDNLEPVTTECRADAGECDVAEFCDGAGSCPADVIEPDGAICGSASDTDCDNPDSCLAGVCAPNNEPSGTACGDGSDTVCDDPDTCDASGSCQVNNEPITTECRADAGECDVAEVCDGAGACPADGFEPLGTACGDGSDTVCDDPDTCDASGSCQVNNEPITTECRADAGECDVAEVCDGAGACPADGFEPSGTACGDGSDTVCDDPDTCDASGSCQVNNEPITTECRADAGECDVAEVCDGAGACPADGFEPLGTACGDGSDTVCDDPDTCDASGSCQVNNEPITTECRADAGECDVAEVCDGAGACPADGFEPLGTACGDGSDTVCDDPDTCDASGSCQVNNEPITTECRADAGECDVAEVCDGAGACPADGFEPSGTACGDGSDTVCDDPDTCDASGSCQVNNEPITTECRADAGECDVAEVCDGAGACPADGFEPSGTACGDGSDTVCDDPDTCDASGSCQVNNEPITTECRADAGECDVAEVCDGAGACPADGFEPSGTACGDGSDTVCDDPDTCDASGSCQVNNEPITTECRADAGECDVAEVCDGAGACPADGFEPSGTACGDGSDTVCDDPDTCDASGSCQVNNEPITTECRADAGECDVAEVCDGAGACPADGFEPSGTACGDGSDTVCDDPDTCDASGSCQVNNEPITTECRADAGECDVAEVCDGAGACPADGFEPSGTACGDGSDTVCDDPDTCDASGSCQVNNEPITTECRADAGECDVAEVCDGAGACPADGFEPSGTACGDGSDTVCDDPDTCDASGSCQVNNEPITTECRADAGECDVAEVCDGAGACPADGFEPLGTACGDGSDTVCDDPDTCDASGSCQVNNEPITTECRADAGECDVAEVCDGAGACPADGFEPSGTACGDGSDTVCDDPDTCDASGSCQVNNEPITTECRADAGECDVAEVCDGAGACPADGFEPSGTACGDGSDTVCDDPDTCDASGSCQVNNEPITTECRADAGECDVAEVCDGAGACPADGFEPLGTACGDGSDTVCDDPDTCDASGSCQVNNEPITTECRADAGECDVAEVCDGAGACPADGFEPSGTACGDGSDTVCDDPDTCDASGSCQVNNEPITTECRADAGECDVAEVCDGAGACPADGFEPSGTACGDGSDTVCDDPDTCDASGSCQVNNEPITTECRADAGECDVAEVCDGAGACPADGFEPSGTACGDGSDTVCDDPDTCDASGSCQVNNEPITTECRADAGECDVAEVCDGAGACPADGFEPSGTACGDGSDTVCDDPDTCDASGSCQVNNEPITTECRADAGECDVAEVCDGAGACPADGFEPSGTACGDGSDTVCDDPDTCDASGSCQVNNEPITTECRADAGECDVAEVCDGAGACPADGFEPSGTACGDGSDTVCDNPDTCSGTANACLPNYESDQTSCRGDAGECDVEEFCDGAGACPADGFEPSGTDCGDDTDNQCTNPDTCDGLGYCVPNNKPCGAVTDSSLCDFDVSTKGRCEDDDALFGAACDTVFPDVCVLDTETQLQTCTVTGGLCLTDADCCQSCVEENQFKVVLTPDGQLWPAYKLNATNPGQFFYNLFADEGQVVTITVPYPFVTQGATPVHVYDGELVENVAGDDCFLPPDLALAESGVQITIDDWISGAVGDVNCDEVCGPDGAGVCTFDVDLTGIDVPGDLLYVNVHLDYGLKGPMLDANPCDDMTVDRYDRGNAESFWGSFDALQDETDPAVVALTDCQDYVFSDTGSNQEDTVQNLNTFKRIRGVFGMCQVSSDLSPCNEGTLLQLVRLSTGEVVQTAETDADGYYGLDYKHTGQAALYTVNLRGGYNKNQQVELRANGWSEVSFYVANANPPPPRPACGLGVELTLLLTGLIWLHRRRTSPKA